MPRIGVRPLVSAFALALIASSSSGLVAAQGEPGSAGGIAVSPLVTPADAEGSFGFVALPEEILAGFSFGFGGFGGGSIPGFDLETILASPELAEFGITVEANGSGLLPRATSPELSGRVLVLLHDVPPGFVVQGARCTDAAGAVVAEAAGPAAGEPASVSVNALANTGLVCDFDIERLPDASLTLVAATIPADAEGTFTFLDLPGAIEGAGESLEGLDEFVGLLQGGLPSAGPFGFGDFGGAVFAALEEELNDMRAGLGGPWTVEANTPTSIGARPPGPHTIILSELEPGYAPQFVSCSGEGSAADTGPTDPTDLTPDPSTTFLGRPVPVLASGPAAITVDLPAGAAVTCTFTVAPGEPGSADAGVALGSASIRVVTDPPDKSITFELEIDGVAKRIGPAEPYQLQDPDAGPHTAILIDPLSAHELVEHRCVTSTGSDPRPYERVEDPPSLTFGLEDDDVVCTFTLRSRTRAPASEVLAPRAGRWRVVNQATSFSCAGITTPVARTTDSGRVALRRGGERIIATGLSDGGRLVLDMVAGEPGRYQGMVRVRAQWTTMRLRYDMRVLNPRRIEGEIRADFQVAGQACALERGFQGRFQGN